jgi:hypothetical protein
MRNHLFALSLVGLFALAAPSARAEQVRFRFVPTDACGTMAPVAVGPEGALGECIKGLGLVPRPYPYVVRPNQMVTFRHPYSGRNVTLPIRMPEGQPRHEYRYDRVVYNYGEYIVEVRFLQDGAADVVYNSGFMRPFKVD